MTCTECGRPIHGAVCNNCGADNSIFAQAARAAADVEVAQAVEARKAEERRTEAIEAVAAELRTLNRNLDLIAGLMRNKL